MEPGSLGATNTLESLARNSSSGCFVLDGGLATELETRGADLKDPLLSAVCLLDPEKTSLLKQVHLDYFRAGADVGISASYQATVTAFQLKGLTETEAEEMLAKSVDILKEAREEFWREHQSAEREACDSDVVKKDGKAIPVQGRKTEVGRRLQPLVAASIGSYGASLADGSEFSGDYGPSVTLATLKEFHRRKIQVLSAAKPDFLAFETIPSLLEAQALVSVLHEEQVKIPGWISFNSLDGKHTPLGDLIQDCASLVEQCDSLVAMGINCTSPRFTEKLIRSVRQATQKLVLVYPNSGETFDGESREWVGSGSVGNDEYEQLVKKWVVAGASGVGGCCRTAPKTIRSIKNVLTA